MKTPTKAEMAKELAKIKAQLARERRKNAKEEDIARAEAKHQAEATKTEATKVVAEKVAEAQFNKALANEALLTANKFPNWKNDATAPFTIYTQEGSYKNGVSVMRANSESKYGVGNSLRVLLYVPMTQDGFDQLHATVDLVRNKLLKIGIEL